MTKRRSKKKRKPGEVLAHYVFRVNPDQKLPVYWDVFVIAETTDELQEWDTEDRYGLRERGFRMAASYRLQALGMGNGVGLPACGAYESLQDVYRLTKVAEHDMMAAEQNEEAIP